MGSAGHRNLTIQSESSAEGGDASYDYLDSSTELLILIRFQTFLPPFLIVAGTIGNLSSLLALLRPAIARHSMGQYLSAYLAVSTVYLYAGCGHEWLSHATGLPNVSHVADWTCRLWKFVFGVVRHSVDWLLVVMVTDRVVATRVALAPWRSALCTPFVARVAVIGVFVGLTVVAIHAMWIYGLPPKDRPAVDRSCGIDERQRDLGSIAWPWLSAVALSYVPNALVLVLAPLLTVEYLGRRRSGRPRKPASDDAESPPVERTNDNDPAVGESSLQSGFTLCCICTAFTFLLCTVPANLVNLFWYVNPPDMLTWYASFATCSLVTCLQTSSTFVWYHLCVRIIRTEFRAMLGEICERCSRSCRRVEGPCARAEVGQEGNDKNTDSTIV